MVNRSRCGITSLRGSWTALTTTTRFELATP
jgi:hypothetical protein